MSCPSWTCAVCTTGSGEAKFTLGIPSKSGVGCFATLLPLLDNCGNSVRGLAFLQAVGETFRLHCFDTVVGSIVAPVEDDVAVSSRMIFAAARGVLETLKRLVASGQSLGIEDYDKRTPLHLACAEGHAHVVK